MPARPISSAGRPSGYEAPVCILTERAAKALSKVQQQVASDGLTLVVFDCYRPARAVDDFVELDDGGRPARPALVSEGQARRPDRRRLYRRTLQPFARLDGRRRARPHRRPTPPPACPTPIAAREKSGTLDFGTGFDCFDQRSYTAHSPLPEGAIANRKKLVAAMQQAGFRNYSHEWWHFTLENEPYKTKRFDFPVTDAK